MRRPRGGSRVFRAWTPTCRPHLTSAISGGQWPQARLAGTGRGRVSTDFCQLCDVSPGTLKHRHACPATVPHGGWKPPPEECQRDLARLSQARRDLLATRGLLAARVVLPPMPGGDSFTWLRAPPDDLPSDATWFVDGSLFDAICGATRRTGFGVAIVTPSGDLVAWGCGVRRAGYMMRWALRRGHFSLWCACAPGGAICYDRLPGQPARARGGAGSSNVPDEASCSAVGSCGCGAGRQL